MTRLLSALALAVSLLLPAIALAAEKAPPAAAAPGAAVKAGDTVHVCGCGASCPCGTIQRGPGKCSCGSPLVKTEVLRVEGDSVVVKPDGKTEQKFKAPTK
jgi:hypothetical protein